MPSRSSRIRAPCANTPASTNSSSTASHGANENASTRPGSHTAAAIAATTSRSASSASDAPRDRVQATGVLEDEGVADANGVDDRQQTPQDRVHDRSADHADDDDRAESVTHQRVRVHQVEAERPLRPAFDEKAGDQQPGEDEGIEGVEKDQALDDWSRDGEGVGAGAGHGTVSGDIVKRYYTHR